MKKIEDLLKDNDIKRVSQSAASSFRNVLSEDEIESCITNAIWKASKKYEPQHNTKFTSYVHRGVKLACLGLVRLNKDCKVSLDNFDAKNNISGKFNGFNEIDMMDIISSCDDPELIYDRFYKNMTISELAIARGVCGETIRIRLEKNLKKIKNLFLAI